MHVEAIADAVEQHVVDARRIRRVRGGGAPTQAPLVKLEVEGTAYGSDGQPLPSAGARARSSAGMGRTANPLNGTTRDKVSVSNLEPPYLIESGGYTVAFAPGAADISPLTSLVVGALLGRNGPRERSRSKASHRATSVME